MGFHGHRGRIQGDAVRRWAWFLIALASLLGCRPEIPERPESCGITSEPVVIPTLQPGFAYELLPGEITFASVGDLYSFDAGSLERVPLFVTSAYETAPAWSPDGQSLAFSAAEEGPADIYVASFDPDVGWTQPYNLTESPNANELTPEWSPDGTALVYASRRLNGWSLTMLELGYQDDGRPFRIRDRRLTFSQRFQGHPDWSPIEPKIAFTTEQGDRLGILVTGEGESGPSPFPGLDRYASAAYPAWSPDGRRLAFAGTGAGNWDIYVIHADGTAQTQITAHPAADWEPVWSPDGRWIAFSSTRDGVGNIFLVRDNGSELVRLTRGSGFDHSPTWGPVNRFLKPDR